MSAINQCNLPYGVLDFPGVTFIVELLRFSVFVIVAGEVRLLIEVDTTISCAVVVTLLLLSVLAVDSCRGERDGGVGSVVVVKIVVFCAEM